MRANALGAARALLRRGAYPTARDADGTPCLDLAEALGLPEMSRVLAAAAIVHEVQAFFDASAERLKVGGRTPRALANACAWSDRLQLTGQIGITSAAAIAARRRAGGRARV